MTDPFELLRQAVDAIITAEWANLHAGIHRPGARRAQAASLRDGRMDEVYRQIGAIRSGGTDPRFTLETVEDRLNQLAKACYQLSFWNQLMPQSMSFPSATLDPNRQQIAATEADFLNQQPDEFLTELCEGVKQALHQVLDLQAPAPAPASSAGDGLARNMVPATQASEQSEGLGYFISVSRICKLCAKTRAPFYWQKAPPGSKHKLEVDMGEFLIFLVAKKKGEQGDSELTSTANNKITDEEIKQAHKKKKAERPLN